MKNLTIQTFSFGDFEFDGAKRLLLKEGKPVSLNSKTFDLLSVLVKNYGQIVHKDELLETVWEGQFVEENNLTVQISALRKIFGEKKGDHQFIVTIPGKGYKFVAEVRNDGENSLVKANELPPSHTVNFAESDSIIGRAEEIAEIKNLLCRTDKCLITLTGAGGTGKTTLAQAVAEELKDEFTDGRFFIELAAIKRPELFADAIAQVLGVKESTDKILINLLKNYLCGRSILLVLDNFEQILSAAHLVKELLDSATNLKILVTSRAPLHLKYEHEKIVLPLNVPPHNSGLTTEELLNYSSVELFALRAKKAKSSFALSEENAHVIAEICNKLDGLPLAIELAAVRVKLLSPQAILMRLEHSLNLLTGGNRDLPPRQRTMRGAIEWSYELLEENEKSLFRRLAIFAGGFTVEAAEAIAEKKLLEQNESVLDLLDSLIDNNLLTSKEQTNGNMRLRMLEVVREFALECLEKSGESEVVRRSHSEFFLALAEEAEPFLEREAQNEWLEKLETEHDNIRAALGWTLKNDAPTAARIAAAVRAFWIDHSHHGEGLRWCKAALQATENSLSEARLKLQATCGNLLRVRGDLEAAQKFHEKGLTESLELNDPLLISRNNYGLGVIAVLQKDYAAAQKFYQKALDISREMNEEMGIAYLLNALGDLEMCRENFSAARPLLEECLSRSKKLDSGRLLLTVYYNLGMIECFENFYEKAAFIFAEILRIAREMGNKTYIAYAFDGFAAITTKAGNREQSAQLSGAADGLREEIGYKIEPAEEIFREKYLAETRAALKPADFTLAYQTGCALDFSELIALTEAKTFDFSNIFGENAQEIIIENHQFSRIVIEEEIEG